MSSDVVRQIVRQVYCFVLGSVAGSFCRFFAVVTRLRLVGSVL